MKRLLLSLTLVVSALAATAQTIGEAFYVYRSDGMINTFFRSEVDSIVYSHYDADSVFYDEIVAQLVYTPDSTYWLPLATVDSIGFVTPETKYKPGVIMLEGDIRSYIVSVDSLTIHFRTDTPARLLPHVGDKLVSMELDDIFDRSFLGEVEKIERDSESIAVVCTFAGLEDVFEQFYYSTADENISENSSGRRQVTASGTFSPGPFEYFPTGFLDANIKPAGCAWKLSSKFDVTLAPTISGKGSLIVHPLKGIVLNLDIAYSHVLTENIEVSGEIGVSHKFFPAEWPLFQIVPFVWMYGMVTPVVNATAKISCQQSFQQKMSFNVHYEASSIPLIGIPTSIPKFTINGIDVQNSHEEKLMLDGSVGLGVYGEIGVALISKKILGAGIGFEGGVKLGGSAVLYDSDKESSLRSSSLYYSLCSSSIYLNSYYKVGLSAEMLGIGEAEVKLHEKEWNLYRMNMVPYFSRGGMSPDLDAEIPTLKAKYFFYGTTIFPCTLGFRLFEGEDALIGQMGYVVSEEGRKGMTSYSYLGITGEEEVVTDTFTGLEEEELYCVIPTVELFGIEMLMPYRVSGSIPSKRAYAILKNNTLTFYYDRKYHYREFDIEYDHFFSGVGWKDYRASIYVVDFDASFKNISVEEFEEFCGNSMSEWFSGCGNLRTVKNLQNLNTSSVTSMKRLFYDCRSLTSLDLSSFDTSNVTDMSGMFGRCISLTYLDISHFNTSKVTSMVGGYKGGMFCDCRSLKSLDVSHFNTSNVTSMMYMFSGCSSLTSLDVSHFNTSNVTSMMNMFSGCSSLTSLDVSHFNTSNVTNMAGMFYGCSSLPRLDVSRFNTSNVKFMSLMFSGCSSLTSLDVSHFNTSNVTSMMNMFSGCSSLNSLDVSKFDVSNVTDMESMFENCRLLTSLDLSHFYTLHTEQMFKMFKGCSSLSSLDLSHFNTSHVEQMYEMFADCVGLMYLDLSGWNTSSVSTMRSMFENCSNLRTIYANSSFVAPSNTDLVFTECNALRGGKGTKLGHNFYGYDENGDEITYECYGTGVDARVDKGKDGPGLFTKKE